MSKQQRELLARVQGLLNKISDLYPRNPANIGMLANCARASHKGCAALANVVMEIACKDFESAEYWLADAQGHIEEARAANDKARTEFYGR